MGVTDEYRKKLAQGGGGLAELSQHAGAFVDWRNANYAAREELNAAKREDVERTIKTERAQDAIDLALALLGVTPETQPTKAQMWADNLGKDTLGVTKDSLFGGIKAKNVENTFADRFNRTGNPTMEMQKSWLRNDYASRQLTKSKETIDATLGEGTADTLKQKLADRAVTESFTGAEKINQRRYQRYQRQKKEIDAVKGEIESRQIEYIEANEELAALKEDQKAAKQQKYEDIAGAVRGELDVENYDNTKWGDRPYVDADGNPTGQTNQERIEYLEAYINQYDRTQKVIDDYSEILFREDFAEKSRAGKARGKRDEDELTWYLDNRDHDQYGRWRPLDEESGFIKLVREKTDRLLRRNRTKSNRDATAWDQLTESERDIYYYILETEGYDAALKYLDDMEDILGAREAGEYAENFGEGSILEQILLNATSLPERAAAGPAAFLENSWAILHGEEMHPYSGANFALKTAQQEIGVTANALDEMTGGFSIAGQTLGKAYQAGVSGIDSIVQNMAFKKMSVAFMGMGAGASTAQDLWQRGATNEQIALGGTLAGIAEGLFEYVSLEMLFKNFINSSPTGFTDFVAKGLLQMGIEGSEEVATDAANMFTDYLTMRSQSEWREKTRKYTDKGYSPEEAFVRALGDSVPELWDSFFGGAVGAVFSVGGGTFLNTRENKATGQAILDAKSEAILRGVAEDMVTPGSETEVENKGDKKALEKTLKRASKNPSASNTGYLFNAVENALEGGYEDEGKAAVANVKAAAALTGKTADITTATKTENGETVSIDRENPIARIETVTTEDGKTETVAVLNTDKGEISANDLTFADDDARLAFDQAATFGDTETANAVLVGYEGGDVARYIAGMREGIELHGKMNVPSEALSYYSTLSKANQEYSKKIGQTMREKALQTAVKAAKEGRTENFKASDGETLTKTFSRKGAFGTNGATYTYGDVDTSTKEGKQARATVSRAADITGYSIIQYDSNNLKNDNSQLGQELKNADGKYVYRNGAIYVDMAAGPVDAQGLVAYALSHELTHSMEKWAPEEYQAYADWLIKNYSERGVSMETLVKNKMVREGKKHEDAYHEVIADASSRMLTDTDVLEKLESLREKDPNVFRRVVKQIKKFVESLNKIYEERFQGVEPEESALTRVEAGEANAEDLAKSLKKLQDLWVKGVVESAKNRTAAIERSAETVAEDNILGEGRERHSMKSMATAMGLELRRENGLIAAYDKNGKRINEVTAAHINNSGVGALVEERQSNKNKSYVSDREILANALQNATENSDEYAYLQKYKQNAEKLDQMEATLRDVNRDIRALTFDRKSGTPLSEAEKIRLKGLRDQATKLRNNIATMDRRLVKIRRASPIRRLIDTERINSYRKGSERGKEIAKVQEKRRVLRTKIKALAKNMNSRLLSPKGKQYIPANLRAAVAKVLSILDTDSGRSESLTLALEKLKAEYAKIQRDDTYKDQVYDPTIGKMFNDVTEAVAVAEADNKARGKREGIYGMTAEMLENVYKALRAFDNVVRDDVNRHELGSALDENLTTHDVGLKLIEETEATKERRDITKKLFQGKQLRPSEFFERLAGYKKDSYWMRVYRMLDRAQAKMDLIEMQSNDIFREVLDDEEYLRGLVSTKDGDLVDIGLKDAKGQPVLITRGMMLAVYKSLLNEDNARHIAVGGLTVPDIKAYYKGGTAAYTANSTRVPGFVGAELAAKYKEIQEKIEKLDDAWEIAAVNNDYADMDRIDAERSGLWERRNKVLDMGFALADEMRQNIEEMLDEKDKAFIAASDEYFDNYSKNVLNDATMQMYGFEKARVEGYFPIHTDPNFRQENWDMMSGYFLLEWLGFMKGRMSGAVNPIMLEDFSSVINSQITKVARYAGLAPALKEFSKLYGVVEGGTDYTNSVKTAIVKHFGEGAKGYIDRLVEDLNGANRTPTTFLDRVRSYAAGAVLTANLRVTLAQMASYPTAIAELGHKAVAKALALGIKRAPRELIAKYSAVLEKRYKGYTDVALGDVRTMNNLYNRVNKKARWLTGWIQMADTATVGRLWYATEYWVQDNKPELEKGTDEYYLAVTEKFQDVVEKTQPNYSILQRPDILRSRNQFTRALTMFMTQRLQNQNIVYGAVRRWHKYAQDEKAGINGVTKDDVRRARNEAIRSIAAELYAAAAISGMKLFADALLRNMGRRKDEDDEVTAKSLLLSALNDFLGSLASNYIGGSELAEVISNLIKGEKWYGLSLGGYDTVESTLEDMYNVLSKVFDPDKDLSFKDWKKVLTDAANATGIPLSNVYKLLNGVKKTIDDAAHGNFWEFKADGELWDWGETGEEEEKEPTNAERAQAMLSALKLGNIRDYEKIAEQFEATATKPAEYVARDALLGAMKKEWANGDLTEEEAIELLGKIGIDGEEANEIINDWREYAIKTRFNTGWLSPEGAEQELTDLGMTEEAAGDSVRKWRVGVVGEKVMKGEISIEDAEGELLDLGLTPKEADEQTGKWQHTLETGSSEGYSVYDDLDAALTDYVDGKADRAAAGNALKQTVARYRELGYTDQQIQTRITRTYKKAYLAADKTKRAAMKPYLIKAYELAGLSASEASKRIGKWK